MQSVKLRQAEAVTRLRGLQAHHRDELRRSVIVAIDIGEQLEVQQPQIDAVGRCLDCLIDHDEGVEWAVTARVQRT